LIYPQQYRSATSPPSVVTSDFNRNGQTRKSVAVLLNNGAGASGFLLASDRRESRAIRARDGELNNDGEPDHNP
jgi:hypothetical protein